ncbi:MAG: hypothetical protein ACJ72H_00895 [Candidatus Sulfotelmatobacter sp.]
MGAPSSLPAVPQSLAEKNDKANRSTKATVFIGWKTKQYACVWLDVYGGLTQESIGVARSNENELAFVFTDEHGETSFTNTFIYDRKTTRGRTTSIM